MVVKSVVRCVLSGTYRKNPEGLADTYDELVTCGCQVLSPHRLEFNQTDILFVKDHAESHLSEETIEKHHLLGISQSDFVWLYAPDGYVGLSAAFEIGYAAACQIPVFSTSEITDLNLNNFVQKVGSVYQAMKIVTG